MTHDPAGSPPFLVPLDGVSNLRDIGGYLTVDGRRVRRGMVFRSAALAKLTEADRAVVARLGIRTICDFRGRAEAAQAPTRLDGPQIVPLPIEPTVGAGLRDILHTHEITGEAVTDVLGRAYAAYALSSAAQYSALFSLLVDGQTPLLFHCSAGKDRTGFGAAMLLTALGVGWDEVVRDFEATNRFWRRDTVSMPELPPGLAEALLRADPALLAHAFDAARRAHGSIDDYLEQALGLDQQRREALRQNMLEDA